MIIDTSFKTYTRADLDASNAIFAFEGEHAFLSNDAPSPVQVYRLTFPTVTHAFAAARIDPYRGVHARHEAFAEMERIAKAPTAADAVTLGGRAFLDDRPLQRADWDAVKADLLYALVVRKFADPVLRGHLLATGDRLLVATSLDDSSYWGVEEVSSGRFEGCNMLGMVLMKLRADLRAVLACAA